MITLSLRTLTRLGASALLGTALLPISAAAQPVPGTPTTRSLVPGTMVPGLRHARPLAHLNPNRQLTVTATLRTADPAGLQSFLAAVYNPASPLYHHFLTPRQFAARFAPGDTIRTQVSSWLAAQGLHVVGISRNGLQIRARGSVSHLQHAFATPLSTYHLGSRTVFANAQPVSVPAAIVPHVVAVSGLTNAAPPQPARLTAAAPTSYSPADMAALYDVAPLHAAGDTGAGQTVAIATFAGYAAADIATYDDRFGLSGTVSKVSVDGRAALGAGNGQNETEADIESVQGMAPGAHIIVYQAPNDQSDQTALDLYNRIVSDDKAQVVTTSWGGPEDQTPSASLTAFDQILQEAAAQGQAWFAASGDSGAYDNAGTGSGSGTALTVDFPAADPWVTAVGGTTLQATGTAYTTESAWSDGGSSQSPVGSGGGLSQDFARPAYQSGPGVANQYSNGQRQVPDVAADADPHTGYAVFTVTSGHKTGWISGGGTSVAAPLWAGFAAVANQAVGRRLGFLNPTLYALGQHASSLPRAPFHDVTQGDNLYYPATPGWDFATGWGSMDGVGFVAGVRALGATIPTLTPTPAPTVSIKKVILLHKVRGKMIATSALKVGESGRLVVIYRSSATVRTTGTAILRARGRVVKKVRLTRATYRGKSVLAAAIRFTNRKLIGSLTSRVTVSLASVTASFSKVLWIHR